MSLCSNYFLAFHFHFLIELEANLLTSFVPWPLLIESWSNTCSLSLPGRVHNPRCVMCAEFWAGKSLLFYLHCSHIGSVLHMHQLIPTLTTSSAVGQTHTPKTERTWLSSANPSMEDCIPSVLCRWFIPLLKYWSTVLGGEDRGRACSLVAVVHPDRIGCRFASQAADSEMDNVTAQEAY